MINHQIRLIRKYLSAPFGYTVADNSSDAGKKAEIKRICLEQNVAYFEIPNHIPEGNPSISHGIALNWVFNHYLKPRRAAFFGFLDHDIYPIRPTAIIPYLLKYPVYGLIQGNEIEWYLWPGFSFFNEGYTAGMDLNFEPVVGKDTGGGNWEPLYSRLDKNLIPALRHSYSQLRSGDVTQFDRVELLSEWVHTFNGSYWMECPDKEDLINQYLSQF